MSRSLPQLSEHPLVGGFIDLASRSSSHHDRTEQYDCEVDNGLHPGPGPQLEAPASLSFSRSGPHDACQGTPTPPFSAARVPRSRAAPQDPCASIWSSYWLAAPWADRNARFQRLGNSQQQIC